MNSIFSSIVNPIVSSILSSIVISTVHLIVNSIVNSIVSSIFSSIVNSIINLIANSIANSESPPPILLISLQAGLIGTLFLFLGPRYRSKPSLSSSSSSLSFHHLASGKKGD